MITYASYASKEMTIKTSAVSIVAMNILVSVLAGLAIFLRFQLSVIAQLKDLDYYLKCYQKYLTRWHMVQVLFYFLILFLFAALTSSISLLELNVSNFTKMIIRNVNLYRFI